METFIVIGIVCLAAAYLVKNAVKRSKKEDRCDCGCTSCPASSSCDEEDRAEN